MTTPNTKLTEALSGQYTIEREVGAGGMATVYLAHDRKHERKVALKVLRPEPPFARVPPLASWRQLGSGTAGLRASRADGPQARACTMFLPAATTPRAAFPVRATPTEPPSRDRPPCTTVSALRVRIGGD